jgi:hypothetical protein
VADLAAVLDACVLFPAALRDTLLRAAEFGLYRPHWSGEILVELERSLVRSGRVDAARARRLVTAIRRAFEDAEVSGYEHLTEAMTTSASDRHVAAAAIVAGASVIVTLNLRDFPASALSPYGVEAQPPDQFLQQLSARDSAAMLQIIAEQAADLAGPPLTVNDILDELAIFAPEFATLMRQLGAQRVASEPP